MMEREEAKEFLINISYKLGNMSVEYLTEKDGEKMREAIKALEQEPCEDCISRAELLKAVDTWDKFGCDADTKLVPIKDCYVLYIHYDDVVKAIKCMPSIQPKTDVLDKIRAEIMYLQLYKMFEGEDTFYVERDKVLAIINKYDAGSEDLK